MLLLDKLNEIQSIIKESESISSDPEKVDSNIHSLDEHLGSIPMSVRNQRVQRMLQQEIDALRSELREASLEKDELERRINQVSPHSSTSNQKDYDELVSEYREIMDKINKLNDLLRYAEQRKNISYKTDNIGNISYISSYNRSFNIGNIYNIYLLRILNKYGPPGPPPEGRNHLRWHEPTHRWRNPANWDESYEHPSEKPAIKLSYDKVISVLKNFDNLDNSFTKYLDSYSGTLTNIDSAVVQAHLLSDRSQNRFKEGNYDKSIDDLTDAGDIIATNEENLRLAHKKSQEEYDSDVHLQLAQLGVDVDKVNEQIKNEVYRQDIINKLKVIGGDNDDYVNEVQDSFDKINKKFGLAIKRLFKINNEYSSRRAPDSYIKRELEDARKKLNTTQWGTRKGLHDAISKIDRVSDEAGKSRSLTNVKNSMVELSDYMKSHEDLIMFDSVGFNTDQRAIGTGNKLEIDDSFDREWEPVIQVHSSIKGYKPFKYGEKRIKSMKNISEGYRSILDNLKPDFQQKFQESVESIPPKIFPKHLWERITKRYTREPPANVLAFLIVMMVVIFKRIQVKK